MADPGSSTKLQRAGQGGCVPARYLAPKPFSSRKFPGLRKQWGTSKGVKIGGDQIEHEDEDPRIGRMLEEEAAKGGPAPGGDMVWPISVQLVLPSLHPR